MTRNDVERAAAVEVATMGHPAQAVAEAAHITPGGLYRASVAHDEGCPCLDGKPLPSCTCEIVRVTTRRLA